MRFQDANATETTQTGAPDARDDLDTVSATSQAPTSGNTITGEGTVTGTTGADVVAAHRP